MSRLGAVSKILWILAVCLFLAGGFKYYKQSHERKRLVVYDLTWRDKGGDGLTMNRWRYVLDPQTHLPLRIDKYLKTDTDADYILRETLIITYPSDSEIIGAINDEGLNDKYQIEEICKKVKNNR